MTLLGPLERCEEHNFESRTAKCPYCHPHSMADGMKEEMACTLTDDEMRLAPLTHADLKATVRCAHAFWKMPLRCPNHDAGVDAVVYSNRTLETRCRECKQLLGVLLLDSGKTT